MELTLSVEQKSHLGRIAAKQFLLITDCWKINDHERRILAGAATRTTISTWRKRVNTLQELQLGNDTYERLICISDIQSALLKSVKKEDIGGFIREDNAFFKEQTLLKKMLNGWILDLYQTKAFLNSDFSIETLSRNGHFLGNQYSNEIIYRSN